MPTTIRLKRVGRKKQPTFRIVVTNSARANDGPSIERLGLYNPRTNPSLIELNAARALYWLREGAETSDTVRSLLRKAGVWEKFHAGVTPEELEEAEVVLGPAPDARKTSQRPPPDTAPAGAGVASAAGATGEGTKRAARATASPEAEQAIDAEAEVESAAVMEAETATDPDAEATAEMPEAAAEEPAEAAAEEPAEAAAPGGTTVTDKIREGSAVPSAEETDLAAAPEEEPAEEGAEGEEGGEPEAAEAKKGSKKGSNKGSKKDG